MTQYTIYHFYHVLVQWLQLCKNEAKRYHSRFSCAQICYWGWNSWASLWYEQRRLVRPTFTHMVQGKKSFYGQGLKGEKTNELTLNNVINFIFIIQRMNTWYSVINPETQWKPKYILMILPFQLMPWPTISLRIECEYGIKSYKNLNLRK